MNDNKYASTNIAATRVLANTKQKTKSISQYQSNKIHDDALDP